jgi:uncharacterized protein
MPSRGSEPLQFVLKLASRCNLNCSYCYVYNKGDDTWRARPPFMSAEIIEAAIRRIRSHIATSGQRKVRITFHGGEPCLVGVEAFELICRRLRSALSDVAHVHLTIQTNGVLVTEDWARVFREQGVYVGVSIDGPPEVHDRNRVDHAGDGSYDRVVQGLQCLSDAGVSYGLLSVVQPGFDGAAAYRHLAALGPRSVNFLLPDYTHDTVGPVREAFGPTPCADFLIPAFEEWWTTGSLDEIRVGLFWSISRLILGAESDVDLLGNMPLSFVFVETDGEIQPLDVLRVCGNAFNATGLNVRANDFRDLALQDSLLATAVFGKVPRGSACHPCHERETCGGGYLPHRYSRARGFDNASVWCADLLNLFGHIRHRLGVDPAETARRRADLKRLAS